MDKHETPDSRGLPVDVIRPGRMAYDAALSLQRSVHAEVAAGQRRPTIIMLEHDPVITVSRRAGAAGHVLADADMLACAGVALAETDRGGDVTYHGPGQLVAYPIVQLREVGLTVGCYIRWLEEVIIRTLACWGIAGLRDSSATGVWVGKSPAPGTESGDEPVPHAKIAAIGVRISRGTTLHGLALNVAPNLDHFGLIVPCGLAGRPVTSIEAVIGSHTPTVAQAADALLARFTESFRQLQGSVVPCVAAPADDRRSR